MKKLLVCIVLLGLGSCDSSEGIKKEEAAVLKDSVQPVTAHDCAALKAKSFSYDSLLLSAEALDPKIASQAIEVFYGFSSSCIQDSLAPEFLMKAGQVAQAVKNYKKAEEMYLKCTAGFHKYKNRAAALFLLARLYDEPSMLNKEEDAGRIYAQIIMEYPNTPYANDAKVCAGNIGKTDEQLVHEFLKKNQ